MAREIITYDLPNTGTITIVNTTDSRGRRTMAQTYLNGRLIDETVYQVQTRRNVGTDPRTAALAEEARQREERAKLQTYANARYADIDRGKR